MEQHLDNDYEYEYNIVGEIYDKMVESTTFFFHVMYEYCDFCVEHNMV